ncbi:hypothetical protein KC352_g15705, partial [Hortaea werneckii]
MQRVARKFNARSQRKSAPAAAAAVGAFSIVGVARWLNTLDTPTGGEEEFCHAESIPTDRKRAIGSVEAKHDGAGDNETSAISAGEPCRESRSHNEGQLGQLGDERVKQVGKFPGPPPNLHQTASTETIDFAVAGAQAVTTKGTMLIGTGPERAPQPVQCQLSPALVDKMPDKPRVEGLNTARGAVDASSSEDGSGRASPPASDTPLKKSSRRHAICVKVEELSAGQAEPSPTSLILKPRHERRVSQSRSEAAAAAAVPQRRSMVADDAVARITYQTYHMEATGMGMKAATGCTQDQTTSSWDTSLKPSATTPDQAPTSSKARLSTNEGRSWCLSMNATSQPQNTSTPETLILLASEPQTESTLRTEKAPSPICTTTPCHAESKQEAGP